MRRTDDSAAESVPDLGINYEYIDLTESTASAADGPAASSVRLGSAAAEEGKPSFTFLSCVSPLRDARPRELTRAIRVSCNRPALAPLSLHCPLTDLDITDKTFAFVASSVGTHS